MMSAISASVDVEPIAVTHTRQEAPTSIVTTLYDLIAALQGVVNADDALVVAAVRHILGSGRATWHAHAAPCIN